MNKIIKLALLVSCFISMSFTFHQGCAATPIIELLNNIYWYSQGLGEGALGTYGIGIGNNGRIVKTYGTDTVNFITKNSGTNQNLNALRVQPTTFEPKMIAVGNNGTIVRSTDSGETWLLPTPVTSANLYGADLNGVYQYAVGDNGTILLSATGGATWGELPSGTTRNFKSIGMHSQSGGTLVIVGEKGTILKTTNSGFNWVNVSLPDTTIDLYSVTQKPRSNSNMQNFYICGSQGKIYKSTDRGTTWVLKNSGTTNTLRCIYFSHDDSGAVTGDNGTVRLTTNGGESWFTDNVFNSVSGSIKSISEMPRSSRTFTAVSDNRVYLVSENPPYIGLNNISSEVPKEFSLSQNYPNPFNPNSKIKFQIAKSGNIKLTVYDLSGKEVEVLVNEELRPGTFEVDFDGSKFASGVYFYKMEAGEFRQTKKMILVK